MAKDSWSARIEAELKINIQELTKELGLTNEDIVRAGYDILKNPKEDDMKTLSNQEHINQKLFTKENFDINNFEEIDISKLSKEQLQDKLTRTSFYKPYDTLLLMQSNRYFCVKSVNLIKDDILYLIIEEDIEIEVSLHNSMNNVEKVKSIYQLKRG